MKKLILFLVLIITPSFADIQMIIVRADDLDATADRHVMQGYPPPEDMLVNSGNWLLSPYNRWSFQNTEMLFPTRTISHGKQAQEKLPKANQKYIQAFSNMKFSIDMTFDSFLEDNYVDGIMVLKDGAVVVERYANSQTQDTRHIMFSVTKSFTGLLMEILISEGIIDESRTIASYVTELKNSAYGDATIRQAMDMEVSLIFSEDYDDPHSDIAKFKYAAAMGRPPNGIKATSSLYDFLPQLKKDTQHGEKFQYASATTEVLGWVMTRATGLGLYELIEDKIYQHINAKKDSYILLDRKGKALAAGGLNITLPDLARFALLVHNDGVVAGQQVIPKLVISKLKRGGNISHFPNSDGVRWSYKSQWYFDAEDNSMLALGIHGQSIYIGLDSGVVVVIQSSWPNASYGKAGYRRYFFHKGVKAALEK